jgi:hypothetical protein
MPALPMHAWCVASARAGAMRGVARGHQGDGGVGHVKTDDKDVALRVCSQDRPHTVADPTSHFDDDQVAVRQVARRGRSKAETEAEQLPHLALALAAPHLAVLDEERDEIKKREGGVQRAGLSFAAVAAGVTPGLPQRGPPHLLERVPRNVKSCPARRARTQYLPALQPAAYISCL